jgi:hypothetical protein
MKILRQSTMTGQGKTVKELIFEYEANGNKLISMQNFLVINNNLFNFGIQLDPTIKMDDLNIFLNQSNVIELKKVIFSIKTIKKIDNGVTSNIPTGDNQIPTEKAINNYYDYSNALVDEQCILILAKYIDSVYQNILSISASDEQKNEQIKWEYRKYDYKKGYIKLEFLMRDKNYGSFTCENSASLANFIKEGKISNLSSLEMRLVIDYSRGTSNNLVYMNNSFILNFKPYEINFKRISNSNDQYMNQVETSINDILKQFKKYNTIFCNKE